MSLIENDKHNTFTDLVKISEITGWRGIFSENTLMEWISRKRVETVLIQGGKVRCIKRRDLYYIIDEVIRNAHVEKSGVMPEEFGKYKGTFLKKKQVAEILGYSVRTIDRLIAEGKLEARKLGESKQSSVRITGDSLDRHLRNEGLY